MKLEVEVLNGLCYCRFRREAIGGCGVEWRAAGLRRGRAKPLKFRIGALMDMRVGSYICFCSCEGLLGRNLRMQEVVNTPMDHVTITCANYSSASFSPFISHVCKSNIFLL